MPDDFSSSALSLPLAGAVGRGGPAVSPLEQEVAGLFDVFRERLLRYILGFGLRPEDAEEIVQEVFLSLFVHLARGGSPSNLRGWIFRVAHNLALKRRVRQAAAPEGEAAAVLPDPSPNPEQQMAGSQKQRLLWAVVNALSETDRRCLFLRSEGLRYREIAKVLDISLGAVSLSLARSLARLARVAER
jgi:RNA polymerase sigma-70 factor (ECF subfamily)